MTCGVVTALQLAGAVSACATGHTTANSTTSPLAAMSLPHAEQRTEHVDT
jgi:hypothetical protein